MTGVPDVTLRQILDHDEDGVLGLLLAPAGQDVAVHGVIIGEEAAARPHEGRIVLATGHGPDAVAAAEVVREAGRRGAAAVVLRSHGPRSLPAEVSAAAREHGVALLARAEWADWGATAELLRAATAFAAAGTADPLARDAPGDGLAALAAEVARSCRASITVEDTRFRVLAHSATSTDADGLRQSTILEGKVPDWRVAELRRSGLLRALWSSRDVIHRPADGDDPERLVVAVRSGGEILGSLWAAADGRRLSPDAPRVLRRAAEAAVPYLLQHRLRAGVGRGREEHALRELLHGDGDRGTHVWSLGLAPGMPCAVLVAERDRAAHPAAERALQALSLQALAHRSTARVLRESHRLTVLLPVPDGDARDAVRLARELDALATGLPDAAVVWIGAGPLVHSPLDAADSYARALLVVRALRDRAARAAPGERPVRHAGPEEVAQTVAVLRVLDAVRPLWREAAGPVEEMIAADLATGGGELVRTLTAYFETGGDVPRAAERLTLHANTLRYRLRRVRERYGIDLDDPDTRLVVTLAVRLARGGPGAD